MAAAHTPLVLGPLVKVSVAGSPSLQMRAIVAAQPRGRDDGVALVTIRTPFDEERATVLAAAPELLEALQRCKFDSFNMTLADLEFCRAAIAKATGSAS